jgi:hypothetical protein
MIVTSPTTFTEQGGNASFHFQNGAWDGTMLKDVGVGPPGMIYRLHPYVPGEGGRCCAVAPWRCCAVAPWILILLKEWIACESTVYLNVGLNRNLKV